MLDHREPVGGLHTRALQPVVEYRVLIHRDVESRGFAHDLDAHVMRVAVGEQVVEVVDGARQDAHENRQPHLRDYEPPEVHEAAADGRECG